MFQWIFKCLFLCLYFLSLSCAHLSKPETLPTSRFLFLVGQGQTKGVQEALVKGQNPNIANEQKVTPLMLASYKGSLEMVRMLLAAGAKIDQMDQQNRTALFYAIDGKKNEIVNILLNSHAQVNIKDSYNLTPLMVAASQGSVYLTTRLLEEKARVDVTDEQNWHALFYAVAVRSQPVAAKLLQAGADINHQDIDGNGLGHLCVERNNLDLLKFLVNQGLDLTMKNRMGLTPKEVAFESLNFQLNDYFESIK